MNQVLQRKIMRGIYYAFAIRTALHPVIIHGFFMLGLLIALTHFVSIGNVIHNMMHIQVGSLGTFFLHAVTNTEAWTLLIVGVLIFTGFSLRFSITPVKKRLNFTQAKI